MTTVNYTRSTGQRLTYVIRADDTGRYSVHLGDKELLRGRDGLCASGGSHRSPNRRKATGAVEEAKLAIERLAAMDES